ncbi:MAG: tRNA (adenosine(37)-N6)-dimethylallyltransferase MiaA [Chitinispirillia bacterium]|jgi:tRNA dimethylallyltransferase
MTCIKKNIIVVGGPTASGKTHLSVSLALQLNSEIISADSRQVYRGMDIGTGKDLDEYTSKSGKVPYHLIDIVEPSALYTLYHYQRDCIDAIEKIWDKKKIPILAGGTGLYIEAVLKNYKIPNIPENKELRQSLMKKTKEELLIKLKKKDPALYNSTDKSSKKRVIRSLEIAESAAKQDIQYGIKNPLNLIPLIICIEWPRNVLKEKINYRLLQRLDEGLVDEVKSLLNSGISMSRFEYFGMEYKHIARYINKETSFSKMVDELSRNIFQLAKRQMTYFKGMEGRGLSVNWIYGLDIDKALNLINKEKFIY